MTLERKIKVEMEIWCSHPGEFHNLMTELRRAELAFCENGSVGGYGFEIKTDQFDEKKIRKALGFKADEV